MLAESLEHLKREIEAQLQGIALLKHLDDAQALLVVIEAAVSTHQAIESLLASMAKGCVPQIMCERDGLGKVFVETEGPGHRATDGGDLDGVGEARPVMVPRAAQEDLGLAIEASERGGVHDAVAIPLIARTKGMHPLGSAAARTFRGLLSIRSKECFAGLGEHEGDDET